MANKKKIFDFSGERSIRDLAQRVTAGADAPATAPANAAQQPASPSTEINPGPEDVMPGMRAERPENFRMLPLKLLDPSRLNTRYEVGEIEGLAKSFLEVGLLHNFVVRPKPNGRYEIISGHRRQAACNLAIEWGHTEYEMVPCNIKYDAGDVKTELALIIANKEVRKDSPIVEAWAAGRIAELRGENPENAGRKTRDIVAEHMGVSPRTAQTLLNIDRKIIPELKAVIQEKGINLKNSDALAALPEDDQRDILAMLTAPAEQADTSKEEANAEVKELIAAKEAAEKALREKAAEIDKLEGSLKRTKATLDEAHKQLWEEREKNEGDPQHERKSQELRQHILALRNAVVGIQMAIKGGPRINELDEAFQNDFLKAAETIHSLAVDIAQDKA